MSSSGRPSMTSSRQPKAAKAAASEVVAEEVAQPHVHASIQKLIESVGIEEYEPQVIDMIVDFIYSYTTDVLKDAQAFGDAAGQMNGKVNLADVELAIHSRADMSFAQAPNLEALFDNAARVNSHTLPEIICAPGLPLPPTNTLLTANAQFRRDGDDPTTVAGSVVSAEAVVPVPSNVPLPAGPPEGQFATPLVPAVDSLMRDESGHMPAAAPMNVGRLAEDIVAPSSAAEVKASHHDEVDAVDDVPFVPPP